MDCNLCENGVMRHDLVHGTCLYRCIYCDNVQFEYSTPKDLENIQEYLQRELHHLTEDQLKYKLSEFSLCHGYTGNDYELGQALRNMMKKHGDERVLAINFCERYVIKDMKRIKNLIISLTS